ncbi:MAG: hypothetical protein IJ068_04035 [Bacilli bacterium]|nr:hypothetical protein [Bacilli bacterium]
MEANSFAVLIVGLIIFAIVIGIYVLQGIFLTKFNKLVNGNGTPLAWIPICNIYLLGKLTVNKLVGWILVGCILITGKFTITINGVKNVYTILPKNITSFISLLSNLAILGLFIYGIIKYSNLKKDNLNKQSNKNKINNQNNTDKDSN